MRARGPLRAGLATGLAVMALTVVAVARTAAAHTPHTGSTAAAARAAQGPGVPPGRPGRRPGRGRPGAGHAHHPWATATFDRQATVATRRLAVQRGQRPPRLSRALATGPTWRAGPQGDDSVAYRTVGSRWPGSPPGTGRDRAGHVRRPRRAAGARRRRARPEARGVEVHVDLEVQRPQPGETTMPSARVRSFVVWQPRPVARPVELALPRRSLPAVPDAGSATAHPGRLVAVRPPQRAAARHRRHRLLRRARPGPAVRRDRGRQRAGRGRRARPRGTARRSERGADRGHHAGHHPGHHPTTRGAPPPRPGRRRLAAAAHGHRPVLLPRGPAVGGSRHRGRRRRRRRGARRRGGRQGPSDVRRRARPKVEHRARPAKGRLHAGRCTR